MIKHKGFPSRMPGTDFQFTVRHFKNKVPPIIERKRKFDALPIHVKADKTFLNLPKHVAKYKNFWNGSYVGTFFKLGKKNSERQGAVL